MWAEEPNAMLCGTKSDPIHRALCRKDPANGYVTALHGFVVHLNGLAVSRPIGIIGGADCDHMGIPCEARSGIVIC